MKFKQKFALLKRNTVTREIAGQPFTFYPISIPMLFDLKSTMEPLMKALKTLFSGEVSGAGTKTEEETRDPLSQKVLAKVTHYGVPDINVLKLKAEQSDATMKLAIETVFGEQNRMLVGRVLADSLRDEFDGRPNDSQIREFVMDPAFDLTVLIAMLGGFFEVNARVFGPLAQRVKEQIKSRLSNLTPSPAASASASLEPSPASSNPFSNDGPLPS